MFKFLKPKELEKDFEKDVTLYLREEEDEIFLMAKIEGSWSDTYICDFEFIDNDLLIKFYSTHAHAPRILMKHRPARPGGNDCWVLDDKKFE
jgi:hypothetical protein